MRPTSVVCKRPHSDGARQTFLFQDRPSQPLPFRCERLQSSVAAGGTRVQLASCGGGIDTLIALRKRTQLYTIPPDMHYKEERLGCPVASLLVIHVDTKQNPSCIDSKKWGNPSLQHTCIGVPCTCTAREVVSRSDGIDVIDSGPDQVTPTHLATNQSPWRRPGVKLRTPMYVILILRTCTGPSPVAPWSVRRAYRWV